MTVIPFPVPGRWKRRAAWAGAAVLACALSFAAGRQSKPAEVRETVRTEWKTVYRVEQVEKRVEVSGPVRIVERRVEVPGGTVEIVRTEERGPVVVTHDLRLASSFVAEGTGQSETVTKRGAAGWRMSLAADPLRLSLPAVRVGLERRLFGPLWAGVSYQHGGAVLVSLSGEW